MTDRLDNGRYHKFALNPTIPVLEFGVGARTRLAELSSWQTATRDDAEVARPLHATRAMDQVSPLNEAAFFDELFHFVRAIGAWELLEGLDPGTRAGALYPFIRFVLVTLMRCVGGVASMLATRDVLLTDEALMGVVGFNAAQVRDGSHDRGLSRRTRPVEIRGPFSYETVADHLVGVPKEKLVALLNGVIRCLAKQGVFPTRINVADHAHAYAVVEQARQNVEGYATLRSLALDRGFLDGKLLSKLDGDGIVIDIPAKSNMTITTDAREMARRAERLAAQGRDLPGCTYTERIEQVRRGSGKNATVDERKTVVRVHAYCVFTCMALVTAFRLHQAHAEEAERRGEDTGIGRFRRQLEMKNRDQVVVFCGEHFGVFRNFECAVLLGATVRDRAVMGETVRAVRNRCGVPTADSSRSASARVPADAVLRPGVSRRRARRDTSDYRGGSEPDPMGDLATSLRNARVAQTRRRAAGDELPRRAPSHAGGRARAPATARMHTRQRAERPAASACRERGGLRA